MSSWKAVLRNDGPICEESVASKRQLLQSRGVKKVRVSNEIAGGLRNLLLQSPHITMSPAKNSLVWAMSNARGDQHTIGTLEYHSGWRAAGWTAEHLVCLAMDRPMSAITARQSILKPRVRKLILRYGTGCHFCNQPMPFHDITVEHWLAKSLGGDSRPENLRLAHQRCNELAGSLSIKQKNRLRYELKSNEKLRAELLRPKRREGNVTTNP